MENGEIATVIERTKKYQFEEHGPVKIKLEVKWIDECTYKLIFVDGNDAWWKIASQQEAQRDLIVTIVETGQDSYKQESRFVDDPSFVYKSTMVKAD